MEYLILFAVLLGMGLLLFVKGIWDRRRQRVYMQEKIRESFGRPGERKYEDGETEGIPRYFEKHREGFFLDDVTWNDLNLDMLFLRMNTTLSSAGQEYLYYMLRMNYDPAKIYRIARIAFAGAYDDETLLKWLKKFYWRFFSQQFKRSCLPDGPKVGSVAVSPRGDLRMPSDACVRIWIDELEKL